MGNHFEVDKGKAVVVLERWIGFVAADSRTADVWSHQDGPGTDSDQYPTSGDVASYLVEEAAGLEPVGKSEGVSAAEMDGVALEEIGDSVWLEFFFESKELQGSSVSCVVGFAFLEPGSIRIRAGWEVADFRASWEHGEEPLVDWIGDWRDLIAVQKEPGHFRSSPFLT